MIHRQEIIKSRRKVEDIARGIASSSKPRNFLILGWAVCSIYCKPDCDSGHVVLRCLIGPSRFYALDGEIFSILALNFIHDAIFWIENSLQTSEKLSRKVSFAQS